MRSLQFIFIILSVLLCSTNNVFGQQTTAAASLRGQIYDSNKAAVGGAEILAANLATNQVQTTTSDAEGRFRFAYLPVGDYEIKAGRSGFTQISQKLTLTIGQALEINFELNAAQVSAQIEISTDTPIVETARTQVAETILPTDVENLPLNGRNYLDLALLVPGVSRTNTGSVQRFAETSAVPGTGISVAGQRNLNNSFIVDGTSADDDAAELAGTYYSQEVIREFQVVTSGAVAEFGRASAGFVNIVTQSGANDLRGKVYGFFRDDKFDARNPVAVTKDKLTQTQYGGSLGGKIIRDRTFYFANFEQTRRNDSNIITIAPNAVAAINNRLNQINYRGSRISTGLAAGGYDITNLFGRVDHRINNKNLFAATYNFYDIDAVNSRTVGGLNAVSRGTNLANRDHTINLSNVTTIGTRSLNELRLQYRNSRLAAPPVDEIGPAINISGVASLGTATNSPTARDIDLFQISNAVSTTFGDHALKFGGEFLYNKVNIGFPGALQGVYTFSAVTVPRIANCDPPGGATITLSALESLTNQCRSPIYSQFQQAFGAPSQLQKNPNIGFFAQDEWRVRNDLTLNFGLRYDAQFLPDPVKTDSNNFAPRFGFAFAPFDKKTVVRGSFGLYYDRIPLRATSNALQRDGSKYVVIQLTPTAAGAPIFPNVLTAQPSTFTIKPNVTRIDAEIENSHSQQANLQIERELPFNSSISVGYLYLRGMNLILSRNANVPRPVGCAAANSCRPDPNFGNISRYESSGDSYYNGLIVSVNKRQKDWASVRLSYTFSKAIDNAGNFFFSAPQNNFDLRDDRGLSDNDQRHRLTLSGTLNSPLPRNDSLFEKITGGFQLSYIFTAASRLPFNIVTGGDRNGDSNFNDRPIGIARNTGRGFDFASLDARVSRRFSFTERANLELLVEGFNLLNRSNLSVPNNTFGQTAVPLAAFGRATTAFDPRQIQLGFRLNF